jgi:hypothetical protein
MPHQVSRFSLTSEIIPAIQARRNAFRTTLFSYHPTMVKHINAHRLTDTLPSAIILLTLPISAEVSKVVSSSVVDSQNKCLTQHKVSAIMSGVDHSDELVVGTRAVTKAVKWD